jgi:hypothetical protein
MRAETTESENIRQPNCLWLMTRCTFQFSCAKSGGGPGFGSGLLTTLVYASEDAFQKPPLHWLWWPAIGAVFIGVGGIVKPRVLGVGYDTIHSLLRGELWTI